MSKLQFYWGSGSPPSWRVHYYLEVRKIPFESKLIEFSKKEHKSPEFLKINPRGKVPAIVDGDIPVYESLAIIEYLEDKFRNEKQYIKLVPEDLKLKAKVLTRTHEVLSYLKLSDIAVHLRKKLEDWDLAIVTKDFDSVFNELQNYDKWAGEGKYLAGDEISLVDIMLVPFLGLLKRVGANFEAIGLKNLESYYKNISQTEAFKNSFPPHYKTTTLPPEIISFETLVKKVQEYKTSSK